MDTINRNILVLDDNLTVCLMLKSWLVKNGFGVEIASNVNDAKQKVKDQPFDLILSDIRMPDADGLCFLSWVKKYDSDILVIMMTGYADIESAVESMKAGAVDYISKPIEPEQLFKKIEEAFVLQERAVNRHRYPAEFVKLPGEDYKRLYERLDYVAENNRHCLLIGARGTGKQSAVRYIYEKGTHLSKPFVVFDNDKPADTVGSVHAKSNGSDRLSPLMRKFREAQGGLLYIRKISQLDLNQQDELLNILTRQAKDENFTQVVMSTDMHKEALQRRLIPKLYTLIADDAIVLPTLKGKKEAITFLAGHFLQFANAALDREIETLHPDVQLRLAGYEWPENMQELKNCILKAALLTDGKTISSSILPQLFEDGVRRERNPQSSTPIEGLRKEYYEKEKIVEALELAKGNKTMAASILNIDRKTLYNKIKLYNVALNN